VEGEGDPSCVGFTFQLRDDKTPLATEDVSVDHHPEVHHDSGAGDEPFYLTSVLAGREISNVQGLSHRVSTFVHIAIAIENNVADVTNHPEAAAHTGPVISGEPNQALVVRWRANNSLTFQSKKEPACSNTLVLDHAGSLFNRPPLLKGMPFI
jgi:hypothetical protein